MRIISKTKDYYDIGLTYGIDPTVVWVREPDEVGKDMGWVFEFPGKYRPYTITNWLSRARDKNYIKEYSFHTGVVLFCGKVYPFVRLSVYDLYKPDRYFFSFQAYEKFAEEKGFFTRTEARKHSGSFWWDISRTKRAEDWFTRYEENWNQDKILDLHREVNSPIIVIDADGKYGHNTVKVKKDVILKDMGFASVVDPWTAFQELSMFIPAYLNTTVNENAVEISDADKLVEHGFNDKSFRHPTKWKE